MDAGSVSAMGTQACARKQMVMLDVTFQISSRQGWKDGQLSMNEVYD